MNRLAFQSQNSEAAFMSEAQRFLANESLSGTSIPSAVVVRDVTAWNAAAW